MQTFVRYGLYPTLLAGTAAYAAIAIQSGWDLGKAYGAYLASLIALLVLTETLHPMRPEWKMTWRTFSRRDLPFLLMGALTLGGINAAGKWIGGHWSALDALPEVDLPLIPSFILAVYAIDFFNYWFHRASHELRGPAGTFLWRMHAAHHLPPQVYVFMHVAAHPLNTIIVRTLAALPLLFIGVSPQAVFLVLLLNNLQGIVSHLNVDIRAGWLNYVLIGTELHRNHHSADVNESKNYAATVALWDQLFGTFYYKPGRAPRRLGVQRPEEYPQSDQLLAILALPFRAK